MPIAAISFAVNPACVIASAATPSCVLHISFASCSTQPGFGNICVNSFCARDRMLPFLSKTIALELVVPWSKARMYFSMKQLFEIQGNDFLVRRDPDHVDFRANVKVCDARDGDSVIETGPKKLKHKN